jgi:hypothetical protein
VKEPMLIGMKDLPGSNLMHSRAQLTIVIDCDCKGILLIESLFY